MCAMRSHIASPGDEYAASRPAGLSHIIAHLGLNVQRQLAR
jgi:hypothetical protein